ncbi:MAG: AbrB/MazE/SpoVT family DNA-binding domain-containing protein [Candidatus Bathyarchaeales archaeon]
MSANSKHKVKVSSKGQIVIPSEIRDKYGYTKGTELIVKPLDENRLLLERVPRLSELFGFLGEAKVSKVLLEAREREACAEDERRKELRK